MIIDSTDFVNRPYKVPNQEESRDFVSFIEDIEERMAEGTLTRDQCRLLGVDLWSDFQAGLETSGAIEQRWIDLRDGAEYTYNNKTYKFNGWVDMIRPGVFSLWIPETTDKLTNVGFVRNNAQVQSKTTEDNYPFVVSYWNEFTRKVGYDVKCGYNYINSFYGFMKANAENYPNWDFISPVFKNRHDI